MSTYFRPALVVSVVLAVGGAAAAVACASVPDKDRFTAVLEPDYAIYRDNVDGYLQRRCGTLDCHGQPGRAYRIYGSTGYRLYTIKDGSLVSGSDPTQEEERRANFQAFVALEPEEMSRLVAAQGEDPNRLLMLRKPLRLERHKGGPAMAEDDSGYKCVVAWLRVPVVKPGEGPGESVPVPPNERVLSDRAKAFCQEATNFP